MSARSLVLCGPLLLTIVACAQASAPLLTIPRTEIAPQVDGIVGQGEWSRAAVTTGLCDVTTGSMARAQMVVSACYDAESLYCLLQCHGEQLDALKGGPAERDAPIWSDSLAEVFIAPESAPVSAYLHFMVNHVGAIADEACHEGTRDLGANPAWQAATGKDGGGWFAEIAIPWASVGIASPRPGNRLRINFARNAASVPELCSWAPLRGGFHMPELFGTAVLAGAEPVVRISRLPDRRTGVARICGRLLASDGTARLTATMRSLAEPRLQRRSCAFLRDGGGPRSQTAWVNVPVRPGAGSLEVCVDDPHGSVVWRQTASLDIPDVLGRTRMLQRRLRMVGGVLAEDERDALARALAGPARRAAAPATLDELHKIGAELDAVECRLHDLQMLAQSRTGADTPTFYISNPCVTEKIQPHSVHTGPLAAGLRMAMAKGEYEPTQIVLCPVLADLRRAEITVTDLMGDKGRVLPSERVAVTPLGFVACRTQTGGAALTGEVPDVLLPNRPMDVKAGCRQPFFITVQSTPSDAPGEYSGTVRLTCETPSGTQTRELPLSVRIYDVTIPAKSTLRTAFVLWGNFRSFTDASTSDSYIETYVRYSRLMLQHRISPITMWSPEKTASGEWDFSKLDRYLSATVPLGLTTLNIGGNGQVAGERNADFARAVAEHLKANGWWDLHYVYGQDEAPAGDLEKLKANYRTLVDAVPDIKVMQTGWNPHPELKGLVRIWCPLTASADMATVRKAQSEGDEVWWYVCCGPTAPHANLFVDYPGIDHRILGWLTFSRGIQGFLYWGVDVWTGNAGPVGQYDEVNYAYWNPNSFSTINGDGYLLYPAADGGALPSLRLALLRDGFEDYELFAETRRLAQAQGSTETERLLDFSGDLIPSLTEYTGDGDRLLKRREEILSLAESLSR